MPCQKTKEKHGKREVEIFGGEREQQDIKTLIRKVVTRPANEERPTMRWVGGKTFLGPVA